MASPRCTVHGYSVGEFRLLMIHARGVYRCEFAGDPNCEAIVSEKLMRLMAWCNVNCSCGRNMILNADTRKDFLARRDAYPVNAE
jgi:hypothetical protein